MKFMGFCLRPSNKSGIILIVVLWVLVVLSVLAIGLGRAARIDLALVKHRAGKLKSYGMVWAAVQHAQNQIRLQAEASQALAADTLYQCGFSLQDNKTPQDLFKDVAFKDGSFDISYLLEAQDGAKDRCYGFQDEERRLNLNGIRRQNSRILVHLFMLVGVPEKKAQTITEELMLWRYGAEATERQSSSVEYIYKGMPFESPEELLLMGSMTQEIFDKIKDVVTVVPASGELLVNVNTASDLVLRSLFRFFAENGRYDLRKADSLARKIALYRAGDDGRVCTADDRAINDLGISGLDPEEAFIYANGRIALVLASRYFRIKAKGTDKTYRVSSEVEAIIDQEDNQSVVFWKRK